MKPGSIKETQHGGDHYKGNGIEPVQYWFANKLDAFQGEVTKLITRFREKGKGTDLKKAIHYIQMLLEFEYGIRSDIKFKNPDDPVGALVEKAVCEYPLFNEEAPVHPINFDPLINREAFLKPEKGTVPPAPELDPQEKGIKPGTPVFQNTKGEIEPLQAEKEKRRYPVKILSVHDGDTVTAEIRMEHSILGMECRLHVIEKCRLRGINAPELSNKPKGDEATAFLKTLCEKYSGMLRAEIVVGDEREKYGRLLVTLWAVLPGGDETCINQEMIDNGHAVPFMAGTEEEDEDGVPTYEELVELVDLMVLPESYNDPPQTKLGFAIKNARTHQRWRQLIPIYEELAKSIQQLLDAPSPDGSPLALRMNDHEVIASVRVKENLKRLNDTRKKLY